MNILALLSCVVILAMTALMVFRMDIDGIGDSFDF